jgi:hypothetical protein
MGQAVGNCDAAPLYSVAGMESCLPDIRAQVVALRSMLSGVAYRAERDQVLL